MCFKGHRRNRATEQFIDPYSQSYERIRIGNAITLINKRHLSTRVAMRQPSWQAFNKLPLPVEDFAMNIFYLFETVSSWSYVTAKILYLSTFGNRKQQYYYLRLVQMDCTLFSPKLSDIFHYPTFQDPQKQATTYVFKIFFETLSLSNIQCSVVYGIKGNFNVIKRLQFCC
ncbi:hypothetical protein CAPTEDRAFT_205949 [Capitella teleta]|uniref:Uncharacterized protein n=1 Tax=Capitella teleta TaxID=283909 RepID=R7U771_CAPTE|nr:hypothetical protein CAPTEDRAFT_205949 [Capitella teleta]|eukprot:ELT98985.1 hypothetical protein CAPTEDRAFT_205949 [Capitella teleta]